MLRPAILYKDILLKKFAEHLFTEDYFYYCGYPHCNTLPIIEPKDNYYQYAIIYADTVVGYLSYHVSPEFDSVEQFGLYSFASGNMAVAEVIYKDLRAEIEKLVETWHRVEWRCIAGNPVSGFYDRTCKRLGGNKLIMHDTLKDNAGKFRDFYIYEVINGGKKDEA